MKFIAILIVVTAVGIAILLLNRRPRAADAPEDADGDRSVLNQLQRAGSDLRKPHPLEFFLYFPTEDAARQASDRISQSGFETKVELAADGSSWLCLATRSMVPEHRTLLDIRREFGILASELDGQYDGWGTPVVK